MTKKEVSKKTIQLIKNLESSDNAIVLQALKDVRKSGNKDIIIPLIKLLRVHVENEIGKAIVSILYDLKDAKCGPVLLACINDPVNKEIQHILVACFWEAGLDASDNLAFFVQVAIEGDYQTCIECISVIEQIVPNIDDNEIMAISNSLKPYFESDKEKGDLLIGLHAILNDKIIA